MKAAQEMGWKTLLVNAVKGNQDMFRIYKSLSFRLIERYPECSDPTTKRSSVRAALKPDTDN